MHFYVFVESIQTQTGTFTAEESLVQRKLVFCILYSTLVSLGCIIFDTLTFLKVLLLMRVLAHTSWSADRQTLRLKRSLILPKLDYRYEFFSSAAEARQSMLDSVHHACVRLVTGAFQTSPNSQSFGRGGRLSIG